MKNDTLEEDLKSALKKIEQLEKEKSALYAVLSNELETPLSGLVSFTDILLKKELDKDSKRYVEIIHKSGNQLLNVVNNILKVTEKEDIKNDDSKFDLIDLELISKNLSINNIEIIKKLLDSFIETAQKIISKIEEESLNHDIVHNLKGVAGNLRFTHLYELAIFIEKDMKTWNDEDYERYTLLILTHLDKLLKQIEDIKKA
jgi:signal transduction histidine kinase